MKLYSWTDEVNMLFSGKNSLEYPYLYGYKNKSHQQLCG